MKDETGEFLLIVFFVMGILVNATLFLAFGIDFDKQEQFSTGYQNITVEVAESMIESNPSLKVIDIRGLEGCGSCQFNKGHLPRAERVTQPSLLYNSTDDILVYSKDGNLSSWFCLQLSGNVSCNIYNLKGGWEAWLN